MKHFFCASIVAATIGTAQAASELQHFRLNEAIPETVVACNDEESSVILMRALAAQDRTRFLALSRRYSSAGICARVTTMVTYRRLIFSEDNAIGLWTVYAADFHDGSRWYVLMHGWTHEARS